MICESKKIIVAPLNWGLGHATRCIPIINALIKNGYTPIIASDGNALRLLQKEFPNVKHYELPSYNINYSEKGIWLKYKILFNLPNIVKSIKKENTTLSKIIEKEDVKGVISDNRFGVKSSKVPSVYITHQLKVRSGVTTKLTTLIHQLIISKFEVCWIPDYGNKSGLAGELSKTNGSKINIEYIGPLSRLTFQELPKKQWLIVILSGPEPQRTILEKKLLKQLKFCEKKILFVQGVISNKQKKWQFNNISMVNFMLLDELEKAINESEIILSRSGYSTIMDLEKLKAKAFFIPTPGQFEQEYLANYLDKEKIAPYTKQDLFQLNMLENVKNYSGFIKKRGLEETDFKALFEKTF